MTSKARFAKFKSLTIYQIVRPFSNFDFIEDNFGNETSVTLPRLLSQIRHHNGKTMIVETIKSATDLKEEIEDLKLIIGDSFTYEFFRLSFYKKLFKIEAELDAVTNQDFIGYAIVIKRLNHVGKIEAVHIYESIIKKSCHAHNFIRGEKEWQCLVGSRKFIVKGYLYTEQNKYTNVCAHAVLRTATARFRPGGLSCREINERAKVQIKNASKGLTSNQIVRVLESVGARCFVANFVKGKKPPAPFHKFIYGSVESGFPVIVFFGTTSSQNNYHVISLFGHTFNQDTWVPNADRSYFKIGGGTKYIPSDAWVSMFVGHDDNIGSNLCIPRHYLQTKRRPMPVNGKRRAKVEKEVDSIAYVIATVPKAVKLSPIGAEAIGADYLSAILKQVPSDKPNVWINRLLLYSKSHQLILRPILISGREYCDHLNLISDWEDNKINTRLTEILKSWIGHIPFIWIIEVSVPELFSANKRKIGEVLLRADRDAGTDRNMSSFIIARLPGSFCFFESGKAPHQKFFFCPSGAQTHTQLIGCEMECKDNGLSV